jgi:hypothetical protein
MGSGLFCPEDGLALKPPILICVPSLHKHHLINAQKQIDKQKGLKENNESAIDCQCLSVILDWNIFC